MSSRAGTSWTDAHLNNARLAKLTESGSFNRGISAIATSARRDRASIGLDRRYSCASFLAVGSPLRAATASTSSRNLGGGPGVVFAGLNTTLGRVVAAPGRLVATLPSAGRLRSGPAPGRPGCSRRERNRESVMSTRPTMTMIGEDIPAAIRSHAGTGTRAGVCSIRGTPIASL